MSLDARITALKHYVASEGRVHPKKWDRLRKVVKGMVDDFPLPLILGGASQSDMAKRVRLLQQIDSAARSVHAFDRMERILYELTPSEWISGTEPPSNVDTYGNEDTPTQFYLLLMP